MWNQENFYEYSLFFHFLHFPLFPLLANIRYTFHICVFVFLFACLPTVSLRPHVFVLLPIIISIIFSIAISPSQARSRCTSVAVTSWTLVQSRSPSTAWWCATMTTSAAAGCLPPWVPCCLVLTWHYSFSCVLVWLHQSFQHVLFCVFTCLVLT